MNKHTPPENETLDDKVAPTDGCKLSQADRINKGQTDALGDTVDRILVGTDRFIIYSVIQETAPPDSPLGGAEKDGKTSVSDMLGSFASSGADHVWLRTKYPNDYECAKTLRANLGLIAAELAQICDIVDSICRSGSLDSSSSASLRRRATEMMARAMEMAYEGNHEGAKALLKNLHKNITTLRDSKNRMRYVQGNLFALVAIFALWAILHRSELVAPLVLRPENGVFDINVVDILVLGAIGAFFAVSATVSSIRVDHSVSLWEMIYTGFVRIPIGVIAAGVTIFLISGGWLLASIQPALLPWSYLLFGFLAGFSEMFVPNALRQVEAASTVGTPANASPG